MTVQLEGQGCPRLLGLLQPCSLLHDSESPEAGRRSSWLSNSLQSCCLPQSPDTSPARPQRQESLLLECLLRPQGGTAVESQRAARDVKPDLIQKEAEGQP